MIYSTHLFRFSVSYILTLYLLEIKVVSPFIADLQLQYDVHQFNAFIANMVFAFTMWLQVFWSNTLTHKKICDKAK